jgi:hypothetical protein
VAEQSSREESTVGTLIARLKDSGESAFNKLSEQLLETPAFMAAFRRALEAKGQVDRTVSGTMDFVNLPSKNDVTRILEEIDSLSTQVTRHQKALTSIEQQLGLLNAAVAQLVSRVTPGREE